MIAYNLAVQLPRSLGATGQRLRCERWAAAHSQHENARQPGCRRHAHRSLFCLARSVDLVIMVSASSVSAAAYLIVKLVLPYPRVYLRLRTKVRCECCAAARMRCQQPSVLARSSSTQAVSTRGGRCATAAGGRTLVSSGRLKIKGVDRSIAILLIMWHGERNLHAGHMGV